MSSPEEVKMEASYFLRFVDREKLDLTITMAHRTNKRIKFTTTIGTYMGNPMALVVDINGQAESRSLNVPQLKSAFIAAGCNPDSPLAQRLIDTLFPGGEA